MGWMFFSLRAKRIFEDHVEELLGELPLELFVHD